MTLLTVVLVINFFVLLALGIKWTTRGTGNFIIKMSLMILSLLNIFLFVTQIGYLVKVG